MDKQDGSLRIGVVTPFYAPSFAAGGVTRVAYDTSTELAARGHDVVVFTSDVLHGNREDTENRINRTSVPEEVDGCEVFYFRHAFPRVRQATRLLITPEMFRTMPEVIPELDVLHVHDFRTPMALYAAHVAYRADVPYLVSPHGALPTTSGRSALKKIFDLTAGNRLLRHATSYVVLTEQEAVQIQRTGAPASRCTIIPNGVRMPSLERGPAEEPTRNPIGPPDESFVVLYLGRLHPRKRIDLLVKALHHPDTPRSAHLVVAGSDDGARQNLEQLAASLDLEDRVHFLGRVSESEKETWYRTADVFALTSAGEGLPVSLLEAASYGLPLLLTRGTNFARAADADAAILVDGEPASIADAINQLTERGEFTQEMGVNARRLVSREYSLRAQVSAIEDLYYSIASRR